MAERREIISFSQDSEKTMNYNGQEIPASIHPDTVIRKRMEPPAFANVGDKSTWPRVCPPPPWACNKWLFHKPESPEIIVKEYLHGHPNPPALKDLEEAYGPNAEHIKKGKSWRSHADRNEANRKRKAWSERQALYDFIDVEPSTAVKRLQDYIAHNFSEDIARGELSVACPGHAVMRKTWLHMKKNTEGAEERSLRAKNSAKKRRENRDRLQNTETVIF